LISISIGYPTDKLSTVLDFVRNGGGLILIHSSATAFTEPEFFKVVGGKFTFHPFAGQELVYRNETPDHPLTAMFPAEFPFKDEVFHFKEPYSRDTMTVLLSVNYEKSVNAHPIVEKKKGEGKTSDLRDDHDYAVSWVRAEGKGRVFFTTLGHEMKTVMDPRFMRHILAAIQYGCGDIEPPNKK
jgi:type 1 glutamine amidotransferase